MIEVRGPASSCTGPSTDNQQQQLLCMLPQAAHALTATRHMCATPPPCALTSQLCCATRRRPLPRRVIRARAGPFPLPPQAFGPLLNRSNPEAALVTLFMNYIADMPELDPGRESIPWDACCADACRCLLAAHRAGCLLACTCWTAAWRQVGAIAAPAGCCSSSQCLLTSLPRWAPNCEPAHCTHSLHCSWRDQGAGPPPDEGSCNRGGHQPARRTDGGGGGRHGSHVGGRVGAAAVPWRPSCPHGHNGGCAGWHQGEAGL